jgi:hypothetical protein
VFAEAEDGDAPDPLAESSLALAGITSAAVQGRSALGPRAGARVLQLGRVPGAPWVTTTGSRQAHLDGFDLHANVTVAANNRDGLEQLARYVLRPPIAQERLSRTADGRLPLTLKAEWSDGTTHLLFEPIELLERLAALTPRPRINLLLYYGVLRAIGVAITPAGARARHTAVARDQGTTAVDSSSRATPIPSRTTWLWAELMQRSLGFEVLACPRCGDRLELIALIEDPTVIRRILRHLGLPTEVPTPRPARPPPLPLGRSEPSHDPDDVTAF